MDLSNSIVFILETKDVAFVIEMLFSPLYFTTIEQWHLFWELTSSPMFVNKILNFKTANVSTITPSNIMGNIQKVHNSLATDDNCTVSLPKYWHFIIIVIISGWMKKEKHLLQALLL